MIDFQLTFSPWLFELWRLYCICSDDISTEMFRLYASRRKYNDALSLFKPMQTNSKLPTQYKSIEIPRNKIALSLNTNQNTKIQIIRYQKAHFLSAQRQFSTKIHRAYISPVIFQLSKLKRKNCTTSKDLASSKMIPILSNMVSNLLPTHSSVKNRL